jgi:hypothetical protein
MPWTERQHCRFELLPDGEGHPSRLYVTFLRGGSSLLPHKQIGRLFFVIEGGVTWDEAQALADEMSAKLGTFCVNHIAAGEDS